MNKVWFITDSSRGLGRRLTTAVLAKGDFVAATARNPQQLNDLVEQYGDHIMPVQQLEKWLPVSNSTDADDTK